jgi:hypothetical protein
MSFGYLCVLAIDDSVLLLQSDGLLFSQPSSAISDSTGEDGDIVKLYLHPSND